MPEDDIKELVKTALNEGFQLHPDLVRAVEEQPELIPKVLEVIKKKKEYGGGFIIGLKDLESFGLNLEIDRVNLVISSELSLTDGLQASSFEELNIMLNDRFRRMKDLWMQRPNKIPLLRIEYILSKGKEELWSFVLVLKKVANAKFEIYVDDGKGTHVLSAASRKIFDELVPGSCVAVKVNPQNKTITAFEDVEFPEVKRKPLKGKIAVISDIMIGRNRVEDLINSVRSARPDALVLLGNIVSSRSYIGSGLSPAEGYRRVAELLSEVPKRVLKIVIPGHEDMTGIGLPQRPPSYRVAKDLYSLQNTRLLSNPAYVTLNGSTFFIYHASHYLRAFNADEQEALKKMLKMRHAAPMLGALPLVPSSSDRMIIDPVPERVIAGGGSERVDFSYRGVWTVGVPSYSACGCFGLLNLEKEAIEWVRV
ncbi:MAG: hypothetical protein ACP5LW_02010 [Nitrososphaeria archaeon]